MERKKCVLCQMRCGTVNLFPMIHSSCFILICFGQSERHTDTHSHQHTDWATAEIDMSSFIQSGRKQINTAQNVLHLWSDTHTHTHPHIPNHFPSTWAKSLILLWTSIASTVTTAVKSNEYGIFYKFLTQLPQIWVSNTV